MSLFFRGGYYRKKFCVSKWVSLNNKNSLKHYENNLKQVKTACTKSPWAYIWEGLLSEGFSRLRFGRLIFGRAYFGGGGGLIIGILRYIPSFVWFSRTEKTLGSSLLRACEILCEIKPCVHLERAAKKTVVNSTKQK